MVTIKKNKFIQVFVISSLFFSFLCVLIYKYVEQKGSAISAKPRNIKLYWFIPDGFRADPDQFNIYDWARAGELPNIKRLMDSGSYGFSIPVFPGHTPTNYATLLTGTTPDIHGVADGPMRMEGYPLELVAKGGFSSTAKRVPPIWYTLEEEGYKVALLSVPGSTPPELAQGITLRGRWGGWGADFPAINIHSTLDKKLRSRMGMDGKVFNFGSDLTRFLTPRRPTGWNKSVFSSYAEGGEFSFHNWGSLLHGYIRDTTDDGQENYDLVSFSKDKKNVFCTVRLGSWSEWLPLKLFWETKNNYNLFASQKSSLERDLSTISVNGHVKIKVLRLGEKGHFRIRFLYDGINPYVVKPFFYAESISKEIGPFVDFVDNYPPQLIYFKEDKQTFIEEANLSLSSHLKLSKHMLKHSNMDVIIHSVYTPNQMLTSRWWLGHIDKDGNAYVKSSALERDKLWTEVKEMYQKIDLIVGNILDNTDEESYIVLSSDHGAAPLNYEVRLNNLFAKKGWLKYKLDQATGEYRILWEKTKVIFLKMDNIYINPEGLGGVYKRAKGKAYQKLRQEVITMLKSLVDKAGENPLAAIHTWEEALKLQLPADRVGDLIIANHPGFGWIEELTSDLEIFRTPLKSGYKQAILPGQNKALWTPFLIRGPGIKKDFYLKAPLSHVDQYPTIFRALGLTKPSFVKGKELESIFK